MGSQDELRRLFKEILDEREQVRPVTHGLLGDGLGNLWVLNDADNRVWFRKNGQTSQLTKVHCWNARAVYDAPVICGYTTEQPTFYQVLSWDREQLEGGWTGMSGVARHGETHIWSDTLGGDDPVMIWTRALMPFRVSPQATPDLTVQVQGPEVYLWLTSWREWLGVALVDLTASVPGAGLGLHRYTLVYIDGATSTAMTLDGAAVAAAVPLPLGSWPAPPSGSIPVGLVHLSSDQTTITEDDIVDGRVIVGSAGGSVTPAAHHLVDSTVHDDTDTYAAPVQGNVVRYDTDWERLAKGTAHQLFKMNAAATLPIWASFDWDEISAAAAADMVHDHSTAAEGSHIPLTSLVDATRGDVIRRGAADWEAYPAETLGAVLIGDGTDIISDTTPTFVGVTTHNAGITMGGASGVNELTIPGNQAIAFELLDTNAIEYLRIDTAPQLEVIWNNGEVDVDFRVAASGITNALFVQGSTGNVTIDQNLTLNGANFIFGAGSGSNFITLADGLAEALILRDANLVEYLLIDTAPQLVVHFNRGEADVDLIISASGITNALRVLGSSGAITIDGPSIDVVDDFWLGGSVANGRLIWDFTPAPDEIRIADANFDLDANDLILDADGDSYLHAAADDRIALVLATAAGQFDVNINGAVDFSFTANTFTAAAGSKVTLAGGEIEFAAASGSNLLEIPTAQAIGLKVVDTNAIEYWRIDTAPQLVSHFNQGEADIDTIISASGVTNALFVEGSTGYLGVGTIPTSIIHASAAGAIFQITNTDANQITSQRFFENAVKHSEINVVGSTHATVARRQHFELIQILNFPMTLWTNSSERLRITGGGDVGIGYVPTPLAQVHIDQNSATGAQPVLLLDQADLSEEFIEFTATVGAGNPIDTAGLGAYYGKVRVMVTGVGYKVLALYEES